MASALVAASEQRAEEHPVPRLKDLQRHCAGWKCNLHDDTPRRHAHVTLSQHSKQSLPWQQPRPCTAYATDASAAPLTRPSGKMGSFLTSARAIQHRCLACRTRGCCERRHACRGRVKLLREAWIMGRDTCREFIADAGRAMNGSKQCELAILSALLHRNQPGFGKCQS